jgi:hypothetical protein
MKIIGKLPLELGLRPGTKSPVCPSAGWDSGYGYGFCRGFASGDGERLKKVEYETHLSTIDIKV